MADEYDILRPVSVMGDVDLHLAPAWEEPPQATTVCGLHAERLASEMFGRSGCLRCASQAVEVGISAVRHSDGSITNLERLIARRRGH